MAGAGLINMQPYTWTPAAKLAVEANGQALQAAVHRDKDHGSQKKKGIGGSLGGIVGSIGGAALGSMVGMPQVGAMLGGMAGGALGGGIGGGGEGAVSGAGEGLGMGMAMGSTGAADSIGGKVTDMLGNSGLATAGAEASGAALKGAGADGNWSIGAFDSSKNGQSVNDTMGRITANSLGLTPNSGMQFQFSSLGTRAMPGALGRGI